MKLTDTHCHLDFDQFDKDRDQVIRRAVDGGVKRILVPGIDITSSHAAIDLAENNPEVYAAVGVHPNSGKTWDANTLKTLKEFSRHPKVIAIGEIGLDFYREWTPHNIQKKIFIQQLELAADTGLPVIIHCREAFPDVQQMIAEWISNSSGEGLLEAPGILHSFSGNIEEAKPFIGYNFFFGISGPVTYKNAYELRDAVAELPLDRILIETDAPYLTPQPRRGKRNEPVFVQYVAEKIAQIRDISPAKLGEITSENSTKLFAW